MFCDLRDSPVHGRGVFTCRDIKPGDKLCIYGGEVGSGVGDKKFDPDSNNVYILYHKGQHIHGYTEPRSKIAIAQFINDGACPYLEGDAEEIVRSISKYMVESYKKQNVRMDKVGSTVFAVATKYIKKDEELFFMYDPTYWLHIHHRYKIKESVFMDAYMIIQEALNVALYRLKIMVDDCQIDGKSMNDLAAYYIDSSSHIMNIMISNK